MERTGVQQMDDRAEIEALIFEYTYRLDAGDFAGFAELFEHGEWAMEGQDEAFVLSGTDEIVPWLEANVKSYGDAGLRTRHVTTNVTVRIAADSESASARSYLVLFQAVEPELPLSPIYLGHYEDEFVKDNGDWRFARRLICTDSVGDMSHHTAW